MTLYDYQAAFGAADMTTEAMSKAQTLWKQLYYGEGQTGQDTCQRLAYTVVNKLRNTVFGEYLVTCADPVAQQTADGLQEVCDAAFTTAMVEGECFLKPCPQAAGVYFVVVPRSQVLVFARDIYGAPVDVGLVHSCRYDPYYFTLLERRSVDSQGLLTIENKLYRSRSADKLGQQVALTECPSYALLQERYTFPKPMDGLGMVRLKTPIHNCVDGSADGVSIYAAASALIANIDRNEQQLCEEFERGESRVIASRDMLTAEGLQDHLFVAMDEDPQNVGITVYSPQLRHEAFLARKQEYLRNVESIIGLRRGMLSDANVEERTATEIASSTGDFNLTVLQLQRMWQRALEETVVLWSRLAESYGLQPVADAQVSVDWGNGILYDETTQWAEYLQMVQAGILKPEVALGWRFGMAAQTPEEQLAIREKYMPS